MDGWPFFAPDPMALFNFFRSRAEDKLPLLERCLSVDLEVDSKTATIFDIAAVRHDGPAVVAANGRLAQSLDLLEATLDDVSYNRSPNVLLTPMVFDPSVKSNNYVGQWLGPVTFDICFSMW